MHISHQPVGHSILIHIHLELVVKIQYTVCSLTAIGASIIYLFIHSFIHYDVIIIS